MFDLQRRLAAGETILIDGATGTELELLDVPTVENAWCALASLTDPDAVKRVHAENIRAGAEVIIANTFVCSRHVLERAGHREHFEMLNRVGIELALEAREQVVAERTDGGGLRNARPVTVAGSISTTVQGLSQPPIDECRVNFADQVRIQAEAGAELFVLEMMRDIDRTQLILDAVRPTGIPTWVGYSCEITDGEPWLITGEHTLAEALGAIEGEAVDLVAIMHTEVDDIDRCLDVVAEHWDGAVGVYAHTGDWQPPNWVFTDLISPDAYGEACLRWVGRGVQVVGGCCGIGPDHIRHLGKTLSIE
ncbi:MAG: homocysteine S-methyltransferase family protein [Acidimicrobiia bacterium]|nr:homocysteine S-methyltransferase family protein [Acidimicrobiia bacterium]